MILIEVLKNSLMITGFVFVMMLVIEYVNVQTRGVWHSFIQRSKWLQYILAALLGAIPGCLGAFTVVAMFSHNIVSIGALVAAMIATSGDEAFVMLAMFPDKAILLFSITFFIGILAGMITDAVFPKINFTAKLKLQKLPLHEQEKCDCFPGKDILLNLRHISIQRMLLILLVSILLIGISIGSIGHDEQAWIKITILMSSMFALFVVLTVPEHFLEEHLWNHIVKIHIPRIFVWTFGTLLIIQILLQYWNVQSWMESNLLIVLLVAGLAGLIPQSGPHLVFVTLFIQGSIPFSILLASSIVQDGHGMLPLLAESKRTFIVVKIINLLVGLFVGYMGILSGW